MTLTPELIEQVRLKIQKHYEPYRADEADAIDIITIVQCDLIERMIADVENDMAVDMPIECDSHVIRVLRAYLPDAAPPQEDVND